MKPGFENDLLFQVSGRQVTPPSSVDAAHDEWEVERIWTTVMSLEQAEPGTGSQLDQFPRVICFQLRRDEYM